MKTPILFLIPSLLLSGCNTGFSANSSAKVICYSSEITIFEAKVDNYHFPNTNGIWQFDMKDVSLYVNGSCVVVPLKKENVK